MIKLRNVGLLAPVSLDFAVAMGEGATASGLFLSAGTLFSVAGLLSGRQLASEINWDQVFARRLFIGPLGTCFAYVSVRFLAPGSFLKALARCNFLCLVILVAIAPLLESVTAVNVENRRFVFWMLILCYGVVQFVKTMPMVSWITMWQVITPHGEKTFWQMMAQCGASTRTPLSLSAKANCIA